MFKQACVLNSHPPRFILADEKLENLSIRANALEPEQPKSEHFGFIAGECIPYYQIPELGELSVDVTQPLILLAEDDDSNLVTFGGYLSLQGYRLLAARDGRAAIDLAQIYRPDLILIDLQMPNLDGITAIKAIRATPTLANVPILAFTAMVRADYRDRCIAAGANEYLIKPLRMKPLLAIIQELLSSR